MPFLGMGDTVLQTESNLLFFLGHLHPFCWRCLAAGWSPLSWSPCQNQIHPTEACLPTGFPCVLALLSLSLCPPTQDGLLQFDLQSSPDRCPHSRMLPYRSVNRGFCHGLLNLLVGGIKTVSVELGQS